MNATIYSSEGKKVRTMTLPENVFGIAWNADLVHEVVTGMQANARTPIAHTKDRSEVSGGGKKPWKQKGTGRARHGSTRSPIWTKGGVAHGPRNTRDYSVKLNRKVKAKALATVLSKKCTDGELFLVDSLTFSEPKTAQAKSFLKALAVGTGVAPLATKRKNAAAIVVPTRDTALEKSFQNMGNLEVILAKDVNPVDLLTYKYVVVTNADTVIEILAQRVAVVTPTKSA